MITRVFALLLIPAGLLGLAYLLVPPVGACEPEALSSPPNVNCERYLRFDPSNVLAYPNYLTRIENSETGSTIVRITNNNANSDLGVHQYSKRQSWNSDGTLMVLSNAILDGNTYEVFKDELHVSSSMNWSNIDPHTIFGIRYTPDRNSLVSWNVVTDEISEIRKFDEYASCTFGDGEGNLSDDDRLVLLVCTRPDGPEKFLVSFDLQHNKIIGEIAAHEDFNWGSFSRSGKYIIVENNVGPMESRELIRYAIDLQDRFTLTRYVEHGDLALTPSGDEFYVMLDHRNVLMVNIETAEIMKSPLTLFRSRAGFGHVSCRGSAKTSRCLLSTQSSQALVNFYMGEAPYRSISRGFELFGYHYSSSVDYKATPKASANRDNTKFVFSSDWAENYPTQDFVIETKLR